MKRTLFNLNFDPLTLTGATQKVVDYAKKRKKALVVTPNVDHIVQMEDDTDMRSIYEKAALLFADGMPLVWLSKILPGKSFPERVTGADLLPSLCEQGAKEGLRIYFMGGQEGVAEQAAQKARERFKGIQIVGTYCPPFGFESDPKECTRIVDDINAKKPDLLFLGVGAPKQEKWANAHFDRLDTGPILCVGASFDFLAGNIKRAPSWIQRSGMEWLWRLLSEPTRLWRRYLLRDSRFLLLALREGLEGRNKA